MGLSLWFKNYPLAIWEIDISKNPFLKPSKTLVKSI